jgi:hypothetical protein
MTIRHVLAPRGENVVSQLLHRNYPILERRRVHDALHASCYVLLRLAMYLCIHQKVSRLQLDNLSTEYSVSRFPTQASLHTLS